jgi:Mn2+/Fe2+ NRAMP family transporter
MTLAEMHRIYLPRWLNYSLWLIAEATIICTDVGQVRMPFPRLS